MRAREDHPVVPRIRPLGVVLAQVQSRSKNRERLGGGRDG